MDTCQAPRVRPVVRLEGRRDRSVLASWVTARWTSVGAWEERKGDGFVERKRSVKPGRTKVRSRMGLRPNPEGVVRRGVMAWWRAVIMRAMSLEWERAGSLPHQLPGPGEGGGGV